MSDSVRKYKITDYAGSTRAEIIYNSNLGITTGISTFNYKPYGDTLDASTNFLPVQTFAGEERDVESSYMDMGYRTYDPLIGRFLQVDPLNESFPNITPYCYSYNSPMTWKDPSGLMAIPIWDTDRMAANVSAAQEESMLQVNYLVQAGKQNLCNNFNHLKYLWSQGSGGNNAPDRSGDVSSANGTDQGGGFFSKVAGAISKLGKAIGGFFSNLFGGGGEDLSDNNFQDKQSNSIGECIATQVNPNSDFKILNCTSQAFSEGTIGINYRFLYFDRMNKYLKIDAIQTISSNIYCDGTKAIDGFFVYNDPSCGKYVDNSVFLHNQTNFTLQEMNCEIEKLNPDILKENPSWYLNDNPNRPSSSFTWKAEFSLIGLNCETNRYEIILNMTYGFTYNDLTPTIFPFSFSNFTNGMSVEHTTSILKGIKEGIK